MAHRHDHVRTPEEERERRERGEPRRRPPAERVLALQRSAGNRAVSELLARAPEGTDTKEDAKATGPRATLPGIGTIPLLSWSFSSRSRQGGGSGKSDVREMQFSSKVGKHSPALFKAAIDGPPMEVEVVSGGMVLKLKGAIVSNYTTSGEGDDAIETWTLDFETIEQPKKAESGESAE